MPGGGGRLILLTGATGYIGGRLLKTLEARGERLRCLARRPDFLRPRVAARTEVVKGDVQDIDSLREALQGVDTAYYLVHAMGSAADFARTDRRAAENFARAARGAGVRRIVYLGGLGRGPNLSPHLASRQDVGRILRESGVPTIEFRASIVIGSGSVSFEMIRSLVDRLPVMITPRWVRIRAQPIAIEDVISYLSAALDIETDGSQVVEIGGADRASYQEIMLEYARQRGLRRLMIPVPLLTPKISSLWLGLVTPVYASIGRELIDSIPHETLVNDETAARLFDVRPQGIRESLARALTNEDRELAATRWSDALSSREAGRRWGGIKFGSRLVDSRSVRVPCPPQQAFAAIRRIGGKRGWYALGGLWQLRGFLDLIAGGAGLRRGRRDAEELLPGDTVDFWRVEEIERDRLLRLYAEMKLPGRAWLQFEVEPEGEGCRVRQTSMFDPLGLPGLAYWYGLYPLHTLVFSGMLKGIARAALAEKR